ncbi:FeoA family protein [Fundidesulfovibrio terrae]|uniref:FeoA family protein n=1 Tax=Fundidesulfovibrio terrae TaxID=2922866 RepID=UPI001FAF1C70|nr:FeoA family protein [Fundidesulfovibrio terrae]
MDQALSLRLLKVGEKAQIVRIMAEGELGRRIRDMGLVPGAEVEVVGRAPLKDPVALRLKGFTLSLRNNEADFIMVSPPEALS